MLKEKFLNMINNLNNFSICSFARLINYRIILFDQLFLIIFLFMLISKLEEYDV